MLHLPDAVFPVRQRFIFLASDTASTLAPAVALAVGSCGMKMEFQTLKDRPKIQVILNRDSVCAGDDCDSHEKMIEVNSFIDPAIFVREVSSGYLPSVTGTGHSWTCELNGVKVAEMMHSGIQVLVRESPFEEENRVYFTYHSARF